MVHGKSNFNKSVVLGLGIIYSYKIDKDPIAREYVVYNVIAKNINIDNKEEMQKMVKEDLFPLLYINFDNFGRIQEIRHVTCQNGTLNFNVNNNEVERLNRLIFEKGEQLYKEQRKDEPFFRTLFDPAYKILIGHEPYWFVDQERDKKMLFYKKTI